MSNPKSLAADIITKSKGGSDPSFSSVVLLAINDNKPNGTTSFADQSTSAKAITTVGATKYDTAQAPTGMTSSGRFSGGSDHLTLANSSDWNFGTGDFTAEGFVRFNTRTGVVSMMYQYTAGFGVQSRNDAGNTLVFGFGDLQLGAWAWNPSNGVWYHFAAARSGTNLRGFVDGTQVGATTTNSTNITGSTAELWLGALNAGPIQQLDGWLCSVRVTKGVARYTANFTPPALPLPTR